jgi:hypothetical protein
MKSLILVAACVASSLAWTNLVAQARAESSIAPPDVPEEPADMQATLHRPPSEGVSLGPLHVRFEETTLEDVRRQIGTGRIAHRGDAGDSLSWLCYTIPDDHHPMRLWMTSGELQSNTYIGGITAETGAADAQPVAQCPALPARFLPVTLDQGLWLGASDTHVGKALGRPSHESDGWRMFDYSRSIRRGQCEQQNWLWTKSRAGHVILIDAGQSSSC